MEKARAERNDALNLAKYYRNRIEKLRTEKEELQHEMKRQVQHSRQFWRNQIMEGESRSGRILRAALLRNDKLL